MNTELKCPEWVMKAAEEFFAPSGRFEPGGLVYELATTMARHAPNDGRLRKAAMALADYCESSMENIKDIPDAVWVPFRQAIQSAEASPSVTVEECLNTISAILASASPHPMEHGAMYATWESAQAILRRAGRNGGGE
jgi:hypothetical protein